MARRSVEDVFDSIRESLSEFLQLQPTLPASKVPSVLHEPAICNGYRSTNQPWRYYLCSLFQLHNETLNVWTHLIGFIVIWIVIGEYSEQYDFLTNKHAWPMLVFGICCLIASLTSATVHLLHCRNSHTHYNAFMVDYIGATMYSFGSGIHAFYSNSHRHTYFLFGQSYLPLLVFVSWMNFTILCVAKLKYGHNPHSMTRKYMMISSMLVQAIVNTIPFGPRYFACIQDETCSLSSLNHMTILFICFALQAFFFASHLPERMFPGRFDVFGHGHQIFHVMSTITQALQFYAISVDIDRQGSDNHADPDIIYLLGATLLLIGADLLSFLYLRKFVPKLDDKHH